MNTLSHCPAPAQEIDLGTDAAFNDIRLKFALRRFVGEPYVGKRMKLFHLARLLRHIQLPPNPSLLECGSGDGCFTDWLTRRWPDATVTGIELDTHLSTACERWARAARRDRLHFRTGNILEIDSKASHDLIICLDVLEHIGPDAQAVRAMTRALKPGGWLVVHTPSLWYQRFDGSMHTCPNEDAWKINPGHVRNGYTPADMNALLANNGLTDVQVHTRHGRWSDLAHATYRRLEKPSALRLLSIPLGDAFTAIDTLFPSRHGNTVFGIGRRPKNQ